MDQFPFGLKIGVLGVQVFKHVFEASNLLGLVYKIVSEQFEPIPSVRFTPVSSVPGSTRLMDFSRFEFAKPWQLYENKFHLCSDGLSHTLIYFNFRFLGRLVQDVFLLIPPRGREIKVYSDELSDLVHALLDKKPERRPTVPRCCQALASDTAPLGRSIRRSMTTNELFSHLIYSSV